MPTPVARQSAHKKYVQRRLRDGKLKRVYTRLNRKYAERINDHGWKHVLNTQILLLWFVRSVLKQCGIDFSAIPIGAARRLDLEAIEQDAMAHHDQGMIRGDRCDHPMHSAQMLWEDRSARLQAGIDGLEQEVVRLLVSLHAGLDFLLLATQIMPNTRQAKRSYKLLRGGNDVADIVNIPEGLSLDKLPDRRLVMRFIELELGGAYNHGLPPVPMILALALIVGADTGDFGRRRLHLQHREPLQRILPYARAEPGGTIWDLLKKDKAGLLEYPPEVRTWVETYPCPDWKRRSYDVTAFAMGRTVYALEDSFGRRTEEILFQEQRYDGSFIGVVATAEDIDEGLCDVNSLFAPSRWVTRYPRKRQPKRFVLEYDFDPRVCPHKTFLDVWGKYIEELKVVASVIGLEGDVVVKEIVPKTMCNDYSHATGNEASNGNGHIGGLANGVPNGQLW